MYKNKKLLSSYFRPRYCSIIILKFEIKHKSLYSKNDSERNVPMLIQNFCYITKQIKVQKFS